MSSKDVCVAAIRQYARKGTPAISVDYLDDLSGGRWHGEPGFHEVVKGAAYARYGIEMVYVYERPLKPHWAVQPNDEIRQVYVWERMGAIEVEFRRFIDRQPAPDPALVLLVAQVESIRKFVGRPDPERQGD